MVAALNSQIWHEWLKPNFYISIPNHHQLINTKKIKKKLRISEFRPVLRGLLNDLLH